MCRWLMKPICAQKCLGQLEQGMVVAVTNMAMPFQSSLRNSVATFLLASQIFTPCLTTLPYLPLSYARYSRQLGVTPKDLMETFRVSLKHIF